ncbi:hypothetical protein LTR95_014457 [Oleoguttula sp. CCFEE 5521]
MAVQRSGFVIEQDHDSVITDLYDTFLLQHGQNPQITVSTRQTLILRKDVRTKWHRFLDSLCFLCDSQCGGKSVVAVGVEKALYHKIFWITTRLAYQDAARHHLAAILRALEMSSHVDTTSFDEIFKTSVERSKARVYNYINRLRSIILELPAKTGRTANRKSYQIQLTWIP